MGIAIDYHRNIDFRKAWAWGKPSCPRPPCPRALQRLSHVSFADDVVPTQHRSAKPKLLTRGPVVNISVTHRLCTYRLHTPKMAGNAAGHPELIWSCNLAREGRTEDQSRRSCGAVRTAPDLLQPSRLLFWPQSLSSSGVAHFERTSQQAFC